MAKNIRNELQISRDRTKIAKLYLQGKTQSEIALEIGVSRQQISYDIKKIYSEWKKERIVVFEESVLKTLNKLKLLESEAWCAWEKSKENAEKISSKKILNKDNKEESISNVNLIEVTETKEGQNAHKPYLDTIFKCIEVNLKILGILSKNKSNNNVDEYEDDFEEIEAEVDLTPNGR